MSQHKFPLWLANLLILFCGFGFVSAGEFANVIGDLAKRDTLTSGQLGLFNFLLFIGGTAIGLYLWSQAKKVFNWKVVLFVALCLKVAASAVEGVFIHDYLILLVCRIVQGGGQAVLANAGATIVSILLPSEVAKRVNSSLQFAIAIGVAFGFSVPQVAGLTHIDFPLVIVGLEVIIGLATGMVLLFVPRIETARTVQMQQDGPNMVLLAFQSILVVFAGLAAFCQQLWINGQLSFPQQVLQGVPHAQDWATGGAYLAIVGAGVGTLLARSRHVKTENHFPVSMVLMGLSVAGEGVGYLTHVHILTLVGYMAFIFLNNAGVGTLAVPMYQDIQNDRTRTAAVGVFIVVQGAIGAAYAGGFLLALEAVPIWLFGVSSLLIIGMCIPMTIIYRLKKPAQQD